MSISTHVEIRSRKMVMEPFSGAAGMRIEASDLAVSELTSVI